MEKTFWTCDRCGYEGAAGDKDTRQMWSIGVIYNHGMMLNAYSPTEVKGATKNWCRTCMAEFGGLFNTDDKEKEVKPPSAPPTIEDYIREICQQEIQNWTGA